MGLDYFLVSLPLLLLLSHALAHGTASGYPCTLPYPKHYVAYTLQPGEKITVDGKLDEKAWSKVAWTDRFVDIQGPDFQRPRFGTWVKMRWDAEYLYIASYMEETDVWANQTKHDSVIFQDNDFEVFTDPDGSTHWYKEFEMNALNTTWDLELNKPYMNGGSPNSSWEMPTMKTAVYVKGPINNPSIKNEFWTVEIAMPFKNLIKDTSVATAPPKHGDQWRINFSRVEWHVRVVDGHYEKVPGLKEDNWVWSAQHAINMHIPNRWGFISFSQDKINQTIYKPDPDWEVYSALVMVYNAEKEYMAIQGYYTGNITQLRLPAEIVKGLCTQVPLIDTPDNYRFTVTVKPLQAQQRTGHIKDDRLIWFD